MDVFLCVNFTGPFPTDRQFIFGMIVPVIMEFSIPGRLKAKRIPWAGIYDFSVSFHGFIIVYYSCFDIPGDCLPRLNKPPRDFLLPGFADKLSPARGRALLLRSNPVCLRKTLPRNRYKRRLYP
jgi:hypothetical protein